MDVSLYSASSNPYLFDTLVTGMSSASCAANPPSVQLLSQPVPRSSELTFVTNITNYIRGEKTVMWRNFNFLYRIWKFFGVSSKFMSFLFQIYVEKNLCGENLCGEKMTSKRSLGGDFQRTIIFYLRDINSSAVIKVKRASWDGHTTQVQPLMMNHDCWKLFFVLVKSFFFILGNRVEMYRS